MFNVIDAYARRNNLIYGICGGEDLDMEFLGDVCDIPFFRGETYDRISPGRFLDNAKSVIVIGAEIESNSLIQGLSQVMAVSLSGADYHRTLNGLAQGLVLEMAEYEEFNFKIQVDSGPLMEAAFALKAGLGFQGKNKSIISEKFGAFFNIGLIVTDMEIEKNGNKDAEDFHKASESFRKCTENCRLCVKACPTHAIDIEGNFNYKKCISYLTQKKGVLSLCEMESMGISIYGCDSCRNVCPYNSGRFNNKKDSAEKSEILLKILSMSKSEFEKTFADSNFFWRGKTTIARNCLIGLYNLKGKDSEAIIEKYRGSSNEVLRTTAEKLIEMAGGIYNGQV